ncbi:MAG: M23 family metallopeptidase [Cyclobacteriaceae bacterium]|nr:M23 family metallopeptidase [Cyclobacteriaceae bacterium]
MKPKKTFSNWLTERYLLIIRNEENFAEKRFLGFTYAKFLLFSFLLFLVLLIASLFLSRTLLEKWFDPRHAQIEANKKLYVLSLQIDSLEQEMERKDQFISLFRGFLTGDVDSARIDSFRQGAPLQNSSYQLDLSTDPIDSQIRQEFEMTEPSLNLSSNTVSELQEMFLFAPISGLISRKYEAKEDHFGVDIVSKKNEPVMSVASGTVILSSWTQDSGYVIAIQHSSNLISVYKHNAELLKKTGSFVNGGDVIAIIGNTGELTDGPHLHFELWYNGNAVNPEDFISF